MDGVESGKNGTLFERIKLGLLEAIEHASGHPVDVVLHGRDRVDPEAGVTQPGSCNTERRGSGSRGAGE